MVEPHKIPDIDEVSFNGTVPFSVVSLPRTRYDSHENPRVHHNYYFLRTGSSVEEAINLAKKEFEGYGFPTQRFDSQYVSGEFIIEGENIKVIPHWDTVKGFNFRIPEGIIFKAIKENKNIEPKVKTIREPTKRLYASGLLTDVENPKISEDDITDILTSLERTCTIMLPSTYLDRRGAFSASKGRCPAEIRIMNYGYIWEKYSTYFEDPDTGQWYVLTNKDTINKADRELYQKILKNDLPEQGIISEIEGFTFRECDKVRGKDSYLYFDGSLKDVFKILKEKGIIFNKGILE